MEREVERKKDVVGTEAPSTAASTIDGHANGKRMWGLHNLKKVVGWGRVGHSQQDSTLPPCSDARP